jgi:hypothetical protein
MMAKIVAEHTDLNFPILVIQNGIEDFTVRYGVEVKSDLDYEDACAEYGRALFHAYCGAGKIDN